MASYNWPPASSGGGGGGVVNNAANVGTGVGIFQTLSGTTLNFKSIINGTGITWASHANDVQATITLAPFSTTDLTEGTNLYYTQARFDTAFSAKSTTNLTEGTNLYFTNERAQDAVGAGFTAPLVYNDGANTFSITQSGVATDGYLSSVDWNTFNDKQDTLTLGNLTDVGTDGIVITGGTGAVVGAGTSIAQHVADSTHNGYLSQTDWSTFNNKQNALSLGNLTDVGTDGITVTGGAGAVVGAGTSISQHVADATHNGYLSSADWVQFNTASVLYDPGVTDGLVDGTNGLKGFADNSSGAAGYLGEYQALTGSNSGISSATDSAATGNLTLTSGDWDVRAYVHYIGTGVTTATSLIAGITQTLGTITGTAGVNYCVDASGLTAADNNSTVCSPIVRVSVPAASTVNVSAVGFAVFGAGTVDITGNITARRMR